MHEVRGESFFVGVSPFRNTGCPVSQTAKLSEDWSRRARGKEPGPAKGEGSQVSN